MKLKVFFSVILIIGFFPVSVLATVASSSTIYEGIDVSNWQGYIDYSEVKSDGIEIVYIKTSQGSDVIDSYFKINYNNAKANDLKVGFYHYLTATNEDEAIAQAEFFASVISDTTPDCKLAMDFESFGNLSNEEINSISMAFLERLKEVTGKDVVIYSDSSNALNVFSAELARNYPLWVAEYGVDTPSQTNWEYWEGFQYTSEGVVNGVSGYVDRDRYTSDILLDSVTTISKTGNEENYNQDQTYTVESGNTLTFIAQKYGTTVSDLVILNKIQNPNLIYPGDILIVPINGNTNNVVEYDTGHIIYTVEAGDTLSELALRFKTTVSRIASINNIKDVNLIYIGEKIKIEN